MASTEDSFSPAAARTEARALFGLVERGSSTAEGVRKLIEVPEADVQWLPGTAEIEPAAAHCVLPLPAGRRTVSAAGKNR